MASSVIQKEFIVVEKTINVTIPANGSIIFDFSDAIPIGYYPLSASYNVGSGGNDNCLFSGVMVNGNYKFVRFNQLMDTATTAKSIKGTMKILCQKL